MVTLRPAAPGDEPFLLRVYATTREEELARVPWPDEAKRAFVAQQFLAQHTHYHREYPNADYLVIEDGGAAIGRLYVDRTPGELHLIDIALLPERRGAGIGTRLVRQLVDEADGTCRKMRLYVESYNPAKRLYERLGFVPAGEAGIYLEMTRPGPLARVS